jgi:hypothetical protein
MKQHQRRQTIPLKWSVLESVIAVTLFVSVPARPRALGIQFRRATAATPHELGQSDAVVDGMINAGELRTSRLA